MTSQRFPIGISGSSPAFVPYSKPINQPTISEQLRRDQPPITSIPELYGLTDPSRQTYQPIARNFQFLDQPMERYGKQIPSSQSMKSIESVNEQGQALPLPVGNLQFQQLPGSPLPNVSSSSLLSSTTIPFPTLNVGKLINDQIIVTNLGFVDLDFDEKLQLENQQHHTENIIAKDYPHCMPGTDQYIQDRLTQLDSNKFGELIRSRFYDGTALRASMCITNSPSFSPISLQSSSSQLSANQRVRNQFHLEKQIGTQSVEGAAILTDFDDIKDLFIVKIAFDPQQTFLLHEFVVGVQLNELRSLVPNFAYMFGAFKCSSPIIDNKKVLTYCNSNNQNPSNLDVDYVLYENITPSVSFYDYVKTCTSDQFLNQYLQILYALALANHQFEYTHYDLHGENVLIRKLATVSTIPYITEQMNATSISSSDEGAVFQVPQQQPEFITSDQISTIIDYGYSHVKYQNIHLGKFTIGHAGISNNMFPLYDAYRLLMSLAESSLQAGNSQVFEVIRTIYKYFNDQEPLENALETTAPLDTNERDRRRKHRFIPPLPHLINLSMYQLTSYIRSVLPTPFITPTKPPNVNLISCAYLNEENSTCLKPEQINTFYQQLGLTPEIVINDVYQAYDLIKRYELDLNNNDLKTALDKFGVTDYDQVLLDPLEEWNDDGSSFDSVVNFMPVLIRGKNIPAFITDNQSVTNYQNLFYTFVQLYELTNQLRILHEVLLTITQRYNDTVKLNVIRGFSPYMQQMIDAINAGIDVYQNDARILRQYENQIGRDQVANLINQYFTVRFLYNDFSRQVNYLVKIPPLFQ